MDSDKDINNISNTSNGHDQTTEIHDLDMDLIDENPDNDSIFNMNGIDELARTIEEEGWTGAIEVIVKPDGRYEISSGHRRYRAMRQLDRKTIPCMIIKGNDAKAKARKLLSSNIRNRAMTPIDWGRAIRYYCSNVSEEGEINHRSRKECMDFFGFSESKISRYLALTDLIEPLQQFVAIDGFPSSALAPASKLGKEEQKRLYDKINSIVAEIKNNAELEARNSGLDADNAFDYTMIPKSAITIEVNKLRGGISQRVTNNGRTVKQVPIYSKEPLEIDNISAFKEVPKIDIPLKRGGMLDMIPKFTIKEPSVCKEIEILTKEIDKENLTEEDKEVLIRVKESIEKIIY